jgi:hypothetical protein
MTTSVSCAWCRRGYEVDDRFAGKTIKCAFCGQPLSIPVGEPAGAQPAAAHGEYALGDAHEKAPSTFRTSPERRKVDRAEGRGGEKARRKPKRSKGIDVGRELTKGLLSLPVISISLAAVVVVLTLLGTFVPTARWTVGVALTIPGLLLCLYGYASGVYIAFTEDDFHGWLCLLFPFYAAYYLVSRWDDMGSRLIMVVVGLVLLGIGGRMLETEFTKAAAAAAAKADAER